MKFLSPTLAGLVILLISVSPGFAADMPDSKALVTAQQAAIAPLAIFDGTWRGKATVMLPSGETHELTQTERVGSFLNGSIKVIEGRGMAQDGTVEFNALAIVSYSPRSNSYNFRSYAQGHEGDFPFEVTPDGFSWSIKAGPATIKYTAVVKDGVWTEIGERLVEGQPPAKMFEMTLKRIGSTDWPVAGFVPHE